MAGVKLQLYQHMPTETVIDQFEAQEWDEFIIVRIDTNLMNLDNDMEAISKLAGKINKHFIVMNKNVDIEFYGIKEEDD